MGFFFLPINNYRHSNGSRTLPYLGCQEPDDDGITFFSKEQRQGWGSCTLFFIYFNPFSLILPPPQCMEGTVPGTGVRKCRDEASYLTHSSQHSSTGEHECISSPPRELWLPSPKGSPSHCFSPRYCLCRDHGHPQTFWFAADISKAEDKTLNKEKVISSCST